ncbi:MAG: carbohydrate ABC transporter permease, partial [Candidatus Atribacteria bacterium]
MATIRSSQYYSLRVMATRTVLYVLLFAGAAFMLLPFFWMVTTSLKSSSEVMQMPPQWIPSTWLWSNYAKAWSVAPFARYFFNSFFMAITTTIGEVITTIMAAYAFAKMKFFGKNALFAVLLATLMIP